MVDLARLKTKKDVLCGCDTYSCIVFVYCFVVDTSFLGIQYDDKLRRTTELVRRYVNAKGRITWEVILKTERL